jgi:ppGpp synthetase/RelA/SpoT-type nucleotidyltranferase
MTYSKTKVDRAGRFFAAELQTAIEGKREVGEHRAEIEEAVRIIAWWRAEHVKPLSTVAANLFRYAAEEGDPIFAYRLKRIPTIARKLLREQGMKLSRMEDIGGVRAVFPIQDAAYRVAQRLKKNWTITRFRDYVATPKADGYRALHLINRNRGRLIEVQLRTTRQDEWANAVEGATQQFPELKFGGGPMPLRNFFQAASELYAMLDGSVELDISRVSEMEDLVARADTFTGRDT